MKNFFKILMMSLGLGFLAACGGGDDDPGKVAESFYKEILAGDGTKAMDYLLLPANAPQNISDKDLKDKMGMMFSAIQESVKQEGGLESVKAEKVDYNADKTQATVSITLKTKNGQPRTETVPLTKTDKGWKLDMNR